jgi:hypothetical protein
MAGRVPPLKTVGSSVVGRAGTAATKVEDADELALLSLPPQAAKTLAPARRPTQATAVRERRRERRLMDDGLPVLGMVASLIFGCHPWRRSAGSMTSTPGVEVLELLARLRPTVLFVG